MIKLGIILAILLLPGLLQAAAVLRVDGVFSDGLVGDVDSGKHFLIEGRSPAACKICYAALRKTNPRKFRTLHIALLKGRLFNERDLGGVAVINDSMARRYWPGQNPIGSRFRFEKSAWLSIVGVVGDQQPNTPEAFLPVGGALRYE